MSRIPLVGLLAIALAACGPRAGGPSGDALDVPDSPAAARPPSAAATAEALLAQIPADTPLVYAALDPLPLAVVEREHLLAPADAAALLAALDRLHADDPDAYRALALVPRLAHGVLRATRGALDARALAAIGLEPATRFALYLAGDATVVRVEISDPRALAAALERGFAGLARRQAIGGRPSYRLEGLSGADVALAAGQLVVVLGEPAARRRALTAALGSPPARALAVADLAALAERHRLDRDAVGRLTPGRLLADGPDADCARELGAILAEVPEVAFGRRRRGGDGEELAVVVPLDAVQRAAVGRVLRPAPAMTTDRAIAALAIGVELGPLFEWGGRRLAALGQRRLACSALAPLGGSARIAVASLAALGGTPLASIGGVALALDGLGPGSPPATLRGRARIATTRPDELFALVARSTDGRLARAQIGGPRVALPLPGELAALAPAALALDRDALALGLGGAAPPAPEPAAGETAFVRLRLGEAMRARLAPPPRAASGDADLERRLAALERRAASRARRFELTGVLAAAAIELVARVDFERDGHLQLR
jgi:hypothetical protein